VISEAETIGKECCAQISGITTGGEEYNRELKLRVYANDKGRVYANAECPQKVYLLKSSLCWHLKSLLSLVHMLWRVGGLLFVAVQPENLQKNLCFNCCEQ
jgi:hypothetical protein